MMRKEWFQTIEPDKRTILFEDVVVTVDEGEILPGQIYMARRNTGWKMLTCLRVNKDGGWVVPEEFAYCFDIGECFRVVAIDGEPVE